jgi:hypothetical protein
LLVTLVIASTTAVLHGDPIRQAINAMAGFPGRALMVFAWTTLGFAALDYAQANLRLTTSWDPRRLPKVVRHEHQISRARTLCELFFVSAGFIWLLLIPKAPFLILGPAATIVEFAPIWRSAFVAIVLLTLATVALHVVNFARPYWTRARSLMRLSINAGTLALMAYLLSAGEWFVPAATPDSVSVDRVVAIINASFHIGFIVTAVHHGRGDHPGTASVEKPPVAVRRFQGPGMLVSRNLRFSGSPRL